MEDIFNQDENAKNIYVIKHKLSDLKKGSYQNHFEWKIGFYTIQIYTDRANARDDIITLHEVVEVVLYEDVNHGKNVSIIGLNLDSRFRNYKPIMYNMVETPNGIVNLSNGKEMPIIYLCELIRYLYRLTNLTVFL